MANATTTLIPLEYSPMMFSMLGSVLVGLSGILPLLIIPLNEGVDFTHGAQSNLLKLLLSFAVGGLLGDVFLHLLPEAWEHDIKQGSGNSTTTGLLVLTGLIVFIAAEKIFSCFAIRHDDDDKKEEKMNNNVVQLNGVKRSANGKSQTKQKQKQMSGYLNLLANSLDNFTHGLALGSSFAISLRLGCLTTFAILIHEIPHEVGDFAILLKAGFTRKDAAIGQIATAAIGMIGAIGAVGLTWTSSTIATSYMPPFISGGFLHIALVSILPELLRERNIVTSLQQTVALLAGIAIMGLLKNLE